MITMEEYTLPNIQNPLLGDALKTITRKRSFRERESKTPNNFEEQLDNHVVGSLIAQQMPDDMLLALRKFARDETVQVLVLRNFPLGSESMANTVLQGLTYALGMGYIEPCAEEAYSIDDKGDKTLPKTVFSRLLSDTRTQPFHRDQEDFDCIVMLGCIAGGSRYITTDFDESKDYYMADVINSPDFVAMDKGDIVLFKDYALFHARHNRGETTPRPRPVLRMQITNHTPQTLPENWQTLVEARGAQLLGRG